MKTLGGSRVIGGVEYGTFPPPSTLLKVTRRCWAEDLLIRGTIRFGSINAYRTWENSVLGDPNEGTGILAADGHQYTTESAFPVFAWVFLATNNIACASIADSQG